MVGPYALRNLRDLSLRAAALNNKLTPAHYCQAPLLVMRLKARRRGIVDEAAGVFVDLKTGSRQPLSEAVEAGLVTAEYENGQESTTNGGGTETKTYAVNSVVDQVPACSILSKSRNSDTDYAHAFVSVFSICTAMFFILFYFLYKVSRLICPLQFLCLQSDQTCLLFSIILYFCTI